MASKIKMESFVNPGFERSPTGSNVLVNSTSSSATSTAASILSDCSNEENYIFPSSSFLGVLHRQRVKSFVEKKWPWMDANLYKCNPDKLAMAGLIYFSGYTPSAKCFVCLTVLDDLKEYSDPWKLHAEKNKDCPFIKLGQRQFPRDYKLGEIFQLFKDKHIKTFENGYKSMQLELYNANLLIAEQEAEYPEQ